MDLLWLVGWWGEWSHSKLNLFIPVYCLVPENQDMFPLLVGDHYVGLLTKIVVCVLQSLLAPPSSHWCKWAHQIFIPWWCQRFCLWLLIVGRKDLIVTQIYLKVRTLHINLLSLIVVQLGLGSVAYPSWDYVKSWVHFGQDKGNH